MGEYGVPDRLKKGGKPGGGENWNAWIAIGVSLGLFYFWYMDYPHWKEVYFGAVCGLIVGWCARGALK